MKILFGNLNKEHDEFINKRDKSTKTYYKPNYCIISSRLECQGEPYYFYISDKNRYVYYQFVKRDISSVIPSIKKNKYFDIVSPFDYGGYDCNCSMMLSEFFKEFNSYCKNNNIVSEFIRFNPLYSHDYDVISKNINTSYIMNHVYIDLCVEFRNYYSQILLRNIKRAYRDYDFKFGPVSTREFAHVYEETMLRVSANKYYMFKQQHLEEFFEGGISKLFGLKLDGLCVAAAMIIEEKENIYYMLGGCLDRYKKTNSFSVLLDEIAMNYKNHKKVMFLGGGNKNIYDFKIKYSNEDHTVPYYIGKKIHLNDIYKYLINISSMRDNEFFPIYREKII